MSRRSAATLGLLLVMGVSRPAGAQWLEMQKDRYSVFYRSGFERDAALVSTWADRAEQLMRDKYGVTQRHYRLSIYLDDAPTPQVDVNTARIQCCSGGPDSIKVGRIEMLTPSADAFKNVTAISSLGLPKNDPSYHAKILMSEYIPTGHYEAQDSRPAGGWRYYSAPNWFVQGLQEYDAIFHTTDRNRDTTASRLSAWAASHASAFTCCSPELSIADDYNGGAAFMAFLAWQFGEDVHARMLRDTSATFFEALTAQTKPYSRTELFARLQQWLRNGAPLKR
jgi:hypothetical protein